MWRWWRRGEQEDGSQEFGLRGAGMFADILWVRERKNEIPLYPRAKRNASCTSAAAGGCGKHQLRPAAPQEARVAKVNEPTFSHQLTGPFYGHRN